MGMAYLDKPDGMPGLHQVHLQDVPVVPNSLHQGCCRILSNQPGKAALTPCDDSQPCCPGFDGLPIHQSCPT